MYFSNISNNPVQHMNLYNKKTLPNFNGTIEKNNSYTPNKDTESTNKKRSIGFSKALTFIIGIGLAVVAERILIKRLNKKFLFKNPVDSPDDILAKKSIDEGIKKKEVML